MSERFDELVAIMDRLREPGGCPWDREQTLETLRSYLIEEAYEAAEAAASDDPGKLREELGDLLLQIVFMARIAKENGWFDIDDVARTISEKLVRRHPHVFGDRRVRGSEEVVRNWEAIKAEERGESGGSALDGIPKSLPALLKAYRMTEKAAALGFDWERPEDVVAKLHEEVEELEEEVRAGEAARARVRDELGDVLFVMANLARHLGVEPETALESTNSKFRNRFQAMEAMARTAGRALGEFSPAELEMLWERAKSGEPGN